MSEQEKVEQVDLEPIDILDLLDDVWRAFKQLFWLMFVLACIGGTVFYIFEQVNYHPQYKAYSSFVISTNNYYYSENESYNAETAKQMSETFPYILSSGMLQEIVKEELDLSSLPVSIQTEPVADTNLFTITVTGSNPQLCYDVLQSVIKNYPTVADYIIGSTNMTEIDSSGVPTTVSNPLQSRQKVLMGALCGVGVFLIILCLYSFTHKAVRSEDDLKELTNVRSFGSIPLAQIKKRRKTGNQQILITNSVVPSNFKESLRTMRTRVEAACRDKEIRSILVTSSIAGEGKSTVAVNLALSLASKGLHVVLVDGDLRNSSVAEKLGLDTQSKAGLSAFLQGDATLEDIQQEVDGLTVIPGGTAMGRTAQLLGSERMDNLLQTLRETYDYIIVDTPPCGILSDASILGRKLDGAIMVVRQDFAQTVRVQQAFEVIAETGVEIIGCVLNGAQMSLSSYGYGYGYGYGKYGYGYGRYGYGYGGYGSYGEEKKRRTFHSSHADNETRLK